MIYYCTAILVFIIAIVLYYVLSKRYSAESLERLNNLVSLEDELLSSQEVLEAYKAADQLRIEYLKGRLGEAGCLSKTERDRFIFTIVGIVVASGALFTLIFGGIGGIVGLYVGAMGSVFYFRFRTRDFTREVLYRLPLALESFILLVESGLGILPAMEKLVSSNPTSKKTNPVFRVLNLVYQLTAHGIPFSQATKMVANATTQRTLRHVLLHLDISGSEGGEIIPSLKSLSDHTHTEWKQSVHFRVKRLENMVIFPVFASVIGLLILAAAAPIASIVDFKESLQEQQSVSSIDTSALNFNKSSGN